MRCEPKDAEVVGDGKLLLSSQDAACLWTKLIYYEEERPAFEQRQLNEQAEADEKIASAREKLAQAEALENSLPRPLVYLLVTTTSILAAGAGLVVGWVVGKTD